MLKGQVSLEVLAAVMILLLTFVLVLSQNNDRMKQLDYFEETQMQNTDCTKLIGAITLVESSAENSQTELKLNFDVNFNKNFIEFEKYYCEFKGIPITAELVKGNVRIKKEDGVVTIENI